MVYAVPSIVSNQFNGKSIKIEIRLRRRWYCLGMTTPKTISYFFQHFLDLLVKIGCIDWICIDIALKSKIDFLFIYSLFLGAFQSPLLVTKTRENIVEKQYALFERWTSEVSAWETDKYYLVCVYLKHMPNNILKKLSSTQPQMAQKKWTKTKMNEKKGNKNANPIDSLSTDVRHAIEHKHAVCRLSTASR